MALYSASRSALQNVVRSWALSRQVCQIGHFFHGPFPIVLSASRSALQNVVRSWALSRQVCQIGHFFHGPFPIVLSVSSLTSAE